MKLFSLAAVALEFVLPALAQTTETFSWDQTYDDANLSLASVTCSDGVNGLLTKGYTTLGSLPTFPNVGGVSTITGWDSPMCGTCYEVTYNGTSMHILAVDYAGAGFEVSLTSMNTITNGNGIQVDRMNVRSTQVNPSSCGL